MIEERISLDGEPGTIEKTNKEGKDRLLIYNNLALLSRFDNGGIYNIDSPEDNVTYDYLAELKGMAVKVALTNTEYMRYKYRPDLLSYDRYGTPWFDFVLLAINDVISPKYFTKKKVYVIPDDNMDLLIGEIYNAETSYLEFNRSSYGGGNGI